MATVDPDVAAAALAARDARKAAPDAEPVTEHAPTTEAEPVELVVETEADPEPPKAASDGLKADLAAERKERQRLAAEIKALREGSFSEAETLRREAEAAKLELADLKRESLRNSVAVKLGLPADAVKRLQGETAEELEADAKELLKLLKPTTARVPDAAKTSGAAKTGGMNDALRRAAGLK